MSSSKKLSTKKSLSQKSADSVPSIEDEWEVLKQEKLIWEKERQALFAELNKKDKSLPENKRVFLWLKNACCDNEQYFLEKAKTLREREEREKQIKIQKQAEMSKDLMG